MESTKLCKRCGKFIAKWGVTEKNWNRFIALQYCAECAATLQHDRDAAYQRAKRQRHRELRAAYRQKISALEAEREELLDLLTEARETAFRLAELQNKKGGFRAWLQKVVGA